MREQFKQYVISLYQDIPLEVYEGLLSVFCIGLVVFIAWKGFQEGREDLLAENIMNVVVFIPVGLLLGIAFKQMTWWKAILIGCSISVSIEALQFFFMRGFSEVDDVIHNSMGCLIGYGEYAVTRYGYERIIRVHASW